MKKISYLLALGLALSTTACDDFFEAESDSVLKTDDDAIDSERTAFYAMCGLLQKMVTVGDNSVILGELRGDLLAPTANSSQDLRDLYNFEADSLNEYHFERDMYGLINNCNYLIARIDTTVEITDANGNRNRLLKNEMAQAKAIRAWGYMQLCTTYGEVYYYTDPMLDSRQRPDCETLTLTALLPRLIADLEPWAPIDPNEIESLPAYGNIGDFNSRQLFIPVRLILGDLYLWQDEYAQAAAMYYGHIRSRQLTVLGLSNKWNETLTAVSTKNWSRLFTGLSTYDEMQSIIPFTTSYVQNTSMLRSMFQSEYTLAPSTAALSYFESQVYAYTAVPGQMRMGDLRGEYGSYETKTSAQGSTEVSNIYVSKYKNMSNYVILYRTSNVYLRYAEALNRLGKPAMALALLKYGLNKKYVGNNNIVPAGEWQDEEGQTIDYCEFGQTDAFAEAIFDKNTPLHARGSGDKIDLYQPYGIEAGCDTMTYVEEMIVEEMSLETAFEGNRFQDLMRIARHRRQPEYLAGKVAGKFQTARRAQMEALLSDEQHWYLPHEGK